MVEVQLTFSHDTFRPEDDQQDEDDSHKDLAGAINRWDLDKTEVDTSFCIAQNFRENGNPDCANHRAADRPHAASDEHGNNGESLDEKESFG